MDIASLAAERQYNLAKMATTAQPNPGGGASFFALADSFSGALQQHETVARDAMTGRADPHALVQAVTSSQMAVETVAALRDRVVEAYQEILRMPV